MKKIFIAAGGTGGHINAALSLGEKFNELYEVQFLTGERYLDYKLFNGIDNVLHVKSKALRTKNPFRLILSLFLNTISFIKLTFLFLKERPAFFIGAGGYVCGPCLLAGYLIGVPVFIVEQNAVIGLTNKVLARFAKKIFVNFSNTKGLREKDISKIVRTGNPIRKKIKYQAPSKHEDVINILVFGGSLGARQINEMMPMLLSKTFTRKLNIIHQVGKGNLNEISTNENIVYKQLEYIDNMSEAYNKANIIIARAGASTISELEVVKRPSVLIPYPLASDNHQHFNALSLKEDNNFYVGVIDNKKLKEDLARDIYKELEKIIIEDKFYAKAQKEQDASENIKNEIMSCLG